MKNNDAFGCTTFRKGNYLGRSYDFFCNSIASSVLHTSRIEGVRYESIGMSGSSFNGMTKDKALDGTIDKSIMNTLFSSIVDGINENGVAISTLVVPRGDKGITTGTNPSKPSITARLVSRVVMDKAYSAKNAIKLLSELNIVQGNWNPEYELHWMIADANDTYIVETVNNRLSYRGPSAVTGELDNSVVAGYDGQLEANVITNFYISGTDFSLGEHTFEMPVDNPTITNYGAGLERFQLIKDAIKDATLSSDEDAMEIINLVQYTNAYKNDTAWYSEFVSHSQGVDNRANVSEGSAYVNRINELKATYQSIFSEGGKGAVRALGDTLGDGASWHSNHQCVYDLANKTMLVYPSENGEHAFRVDIHGVVEDEAVEIEGAGGGSEGTLTAPFIFVDKDSDGFKYFLARKEYIDENDQFHYSSPSNSAETIYCDACSFCGDFKNGGCTYAPNTFNTALENNKNEYDGFCTPESFPITLLDGSTPVYTVSDEGGGETSDPDVN